MLPGRAVFVAEAAGALDSCDVDAEVTSETNVGDEVQASGARL
jgi:hypothetical protein